MKRKESISAAASRTGTRAAAPRVPRKKTTRNLTVSLPVVLVRNAKASAARRGISLNAYVHESLNKTVRNDDRYYAAGERILEIARTPLYNLSRGKFKREDLYDV
ncbi:MAG: hypothetical protein ABI165_08685 [Bryobacteraceae bacterium]